MMLLVVRYMVVMLSTVAKLTVVTGGMTGGVTAHKGRFFTKEGVKAQKIR